jgi:hypothetical protein
MTWEYEGLFDVLPNDEPSLMDSFWKTEATAARIGSMAYRTRTTKAGDRLELPDIRAAVEGDGRATVKAGPRTFTVTATLSERERHLILCGGLLASLR